ncbi:uncharacterized protein N7503_009372 [Penicillium pulvis]|uniref:uncharacterized protein n=1 Tax=Penicillium pulvis TaxID=1562058 RepID=UPI002546B29F|nr:uncharacterized protein N7503_009372 [Penicillium pulvis]KAJ5793394.1 hypothetical protein N7503_009372 [Penicillium pulvis]
MEHQDLSQQLIPQSPINMSSSMAFNTLGLWNYDSIIDISSMTTTDDSVSFDTIDSFINGSTNYLSVDSFEIASAINGFTMPAKDTVSMSSTFDSDSQSWSIRQSIMTPSVSEKQSKQTTRSSTSTQNSSRRWRLSPEIRPQEYIAPREESTSSCETRSLSQDSHQSNTGQDPQMRIAAKRAAHNITEKRYRTKINTKFLSLEKAISPAGIHKKSSRAGTQFLKKSEILTNAIAYIESIKHENQVMRKELAILKRNMVLNSM